MKIPSAILLIFVAGALASCPGKKTNSKLICYYSKLREVDSCKCSHVVLPASSDVKSIDRIRVRLKGVKILITVNEFSQGLVDILKSSKVDGIEIGLKKLDSKNDISDFISTVRSKLGADLYIILSVPPKAETVAKYYDFKTLSRNADLFVLQTAFLGASKNVTFHPSRLSGLWDMQNTVRLRNEKIINPIKDSVVDLVSGLGAPLSKLVITSPVQAFRFKLQDGKFTAPGSPALEVQSLDRNELCRIMKNGGNWTLERDQDQAGPYIFR
ncbi:mucin-17-like [Asbolus verrucosus]|uniref:Mucin-17-like n=1 Tax=Asbolus verrucosus TaxID=1661398 RepID=A0A482V8R0_ASBVE|nr:mucin-17-like [Asbolus verrucosus]